MNEDFPQNPLLPELLVSNLKQSLHFYLDILGFRLRFKRQEPPFAFLEYQGSQLLIQELQRGEAKEENLEYPFGRGINFQIETKEIKAIIEALERHKYPLTRGVKDSWYQNGSIAYGCREALVKDPDGYLLRFTQDLGTR